jgi:hypothetical protein
MKGSLIFWGEVQCVAKYKNGNACKNPAYYTGQLCGQHSKKDNRRELPKNPRAAEIEKEKVNERISKAVPTDNPVITATKIRMMKKPVPRDGFLLVCPNNKHFHNYGYPGNYSTLSPMKLGPVENGLALNIENYHQYAKVFPCEMSDIPCDCGRPFEHFKPLKTFYELRTKGYADPVPHRHKYDPKEIKKQNKGNVNKPMFSVQFTPEERHFSYVESRYFYCNQMEILATQQRAFEELKDKYQVGYSLDIHGYDAYEPDGTDSESLYKHYCDDSRPFGHEMVILTLLVLTPDQYPWKRYRREHQDVYETIQNKKTKI